MHPSYGDAGCSLNVFSLKCCYFSELYSFLWRYLAVQSTSTDTEGSALYLIVHTLTGQEPRIYVQISKKTQYLMNTLYIICRQVRQKKKTRQMVNYVTKNCQPRSYDCFCWACCCCRPPSGQSCSSASPAADQTGSCSKNDNE